MIPNQFQEIRERVSAMDAAKHYGLSFDRTGKKALCPYHEDKHPSLSFYRNGFRCFACGAHGSSLDLTMLLLGLDLRGAARRLNDDFGLGLDIDRPMTGAEREAAHSLANARKLFTEWRERTLNELDAAIRVANTASMESPTDAETIAVRYRETFIYWEEILLYAPLSEQIQIFRDREDIARLCRMTLPHTQKKSRAS